MFKINLTTRRLFIQIALTVLMTTFAAMSFAQFAGGNGTQDNPFQVETVAHLQLIGTNYVGAQHANVYFRQIGHIDISGVAQWIPIGTAAAPFQGKYNGADFELRSMRRTQSLSFFGLFGYTGTGAVLENIHLTDVNIYANSASGTLAARATDTVVRNCSVQGARRYINATQGGLIGQTTGNTSITRCRVQMTMTDNGSGGRAGAIVGWHQATGDIVECFAVIEMISTGANDPCAGGLVANLANGSIRNSYVIGSIRTSQPRGRMGGLVGDNAGRPIVNSFAVVTILTEGAGPIGGLIAQGNAAAVTNSYWNHELTGVGVSPGGGEPLNTLEMLDQDSFVEWNFAADGVWRMDENSYPYLAWEGNQARAHSIPPLALPPSRVAATIGDDNDAITITWEEPSLLEPNGYNVYRNNQRVNQQLIQDERYNDTGVEIWAPYTYTVRAVYTIDNEPVESTNSAAIWIIIPVFAGGRGTAEDPWQVATASQLSGIRYFLDARYLQVEDIDLEEIANWEPIGNSTVGQRFRGVYDGGYHQIQNLTLNRVASWQGLFGYLENGTIRRLGLTDVDVTASSYAAALAAFTQGGRIDSCYVTGSVRGQMMIGGMIGYNNGTQVNGSFMVGSVTSTSTNSYVGGLVGYMTGTPTIANCYSTATVTGHTTRIGGLVGEAHSGTITKSYATGAVSATAANPTDMGGLMGRVTNGTANNSFWNVETTGQAESAGGGQGINSAQMTRLGTFEQAEWDFEDVWDMEEGVTYPYLQYEGEPGDHVTPPAILPPSNLRAQIAEDLDVATILWDEPTVLEPEGYHIYRGGERINQQLIQDDEFDDTNIQVWSIYVYTVTAVYSVNEELIESAHSAPLRLLIDDFEGGNGTAETPYLVANEVQLSGMRHLLNAHYRQTANIDLSRQAWQPIGTNALPFIGTFNGNNFAITEMNFNTAGQFQGLFGYTNSANLSNVTLEDVNLQGGSDVGALVGRAAGTTIINNCKSTGEVRGTTYVGGLVGYYSGTMTECSSWANVTGTGNMVGGLIGDSWGTLHRSYAIGDVQGGNLVGGLAGYDTNGSVNACFATGNVRGTNEVGGLLGRLRTSTLNDSFATGSVNGNNNVGGLLGTNTSNVFRCYSIGRVTGQNNVGGLIGAVEGVRTVQNSYWNVRTSEQEESEGGEPRDERHMTFPYTDDTYVGWNFNNLWVADQEGNRNAGYPFFEWMPLLMALVPNVAGNPNPANNAVNVAADIDSLRWTYVINEAFTNPVGFRAYFNTTGEFDEDDDFVWIPYVHRHEDYGTGDLFPEEGLTYQTTYFWKVVPTITDPDDDGRGANRRRQNASLDRESLSHRGDAENVPVWRFTTQINPKPTTAHSPIPEDDAEDVAVTLSNLQWGFTISQNHANPAGFRVYFNDTGEFEEDDDFHWVAFSQHQTNYSSGALLPEELDYNATYYWKVVPTRTIPNRNGENDRRRSRMHADTSRDVSSYRLDAENVAVWTFTTISSNPNPQPATNPNPEHLATGISLGLTSVSWDYVSSDIYTDPVGFRVYMNTTGAFGANAPYEWVDYEEGEETYSCMDVVPVPLDPNTTYFWRVVPTTIHPNRSENRNRHQAAFERSDAVTRGDAENSPVWRFTTGTTDVESIHELPVLTELQRNYPNPFNPETTISFSLAEAGEVSITVYNSRGQQITTLINDNLAAGAHNVIWNGRDNNNQEVGSGIYFYRMKSGSYTSTNKMILMK